MPYDVVVPIAVGTVVRERWAFRGGDTAVAGHICSPGCAAGRNVRPMDLARHHTIRESSHRILDPFTDAQLATLGCGVFALVLRP